jgi:hypothetical protein
VTEQAYRVTLWRTTPGMLFGTRTREVMTGVQRWVDLNDKAAVTAEMATLIDLSGGDMENIEQYRLDVRDLVTGGEVSIVRHSWAELQALREGPAEPRLANGLTLESVSDEALVREMARRLRVR